MIAFRPISRLAVAFMLISLAFISIMTGCGAKNPALDMVMVPDLSGLTVKEAQTVLQEAGLLPGETIDTHSKEVPAGNVISTVPSAGEELARGAPVDITASRGPEMIAVPALLGSAEAAALAALQAEGFQAEVRRVYSESVSSGLVCALEPAPGAMAMPGSQVEVTISLGSAYTACGTCGGYGTVTVDMTCPDCGGTGTCYT